MSDRARTPRFPFRASVAAAITTLAIVVAACGSPIAANPPVARSSPLPRPMPSSGPPDPRPIVFPADDGPHRRLTEWWYYTGHLQDEQTGDRYGFEFVVFRAERGTFPVSWASHLALTDETHPRFVYAQRSEVGTAVDGSPRDAGGAPTGFDLTLRGIDPERPATAANPPWSMTRAGGMERLRAELSAEEAARAGVAFGVDLQLDDGPAVLHDRDGWIDFGDAGGSYYYSRPRLPATGSLIVDGHRLRVRGEAWFDHQWGDFIAVGGGGWDWFAVNLADGTDLTLSLVRDAQGGYPLVYGTLRRPTGEVIHLPESAFRVTSTGSWTSARSHAAYPAGWRVDIPDERLTIELTPTVADQELDTRPTTGVVYWEGSQVVRAVHDGHALGGEGYVELTGYASKVSAEPAPSQPASIAP